MSIRSAAQERGEIRSLRRVVPVRTVVAISLLAAAASAAPPLPDTDTLLADVGLSADEIAQVKTGQLVRHSIDAASERELTAAMAFLVKATPAQLVADSKRDLLDQTMADTVSYGTVSGPGAIADFAGLALKPEAEKRAQAYVSASPSEDLNLSAEEIAAFNALGSGASVAAVEKELRDQLLARLQAYRTRGLAGIAPYARSGGGPRSPAEALRIATTASKALEKYVPSAYQLLLSYPRGKPPGTEETFRWEQIDAHDEPAIVLTQMLMVPDGDAWVAVQRQYYASAGYNAEQAIAALLPTTEGTVVVYANRTSTDQVTGFGGSEKRAIGSRVLSSQLEDMFEKTRAKVDQ